MCVDIVLYGEGEFRLENFPLSLYLLPACVGSVSSWGRPFNIFGDEFKLVGRFMLAITQKLLERKILQLNGLVRKFERHIVDSFIAWIYFPDVID